MYWLFRKEKLCEGAHKCGEAMMQNGGFDPCYECPAVKMDRAMESIRGRRIGLVTTLDRLRQAGITYGPDDLTFAESLLLVILAEERDKFTEELMKQASSKRK